VIGVTASRSIIHNEAMASLDSQIDELYQGSLENFTAARNALAKTLAGEARKQVAALPKPVAIAWIVNQTYWHARKAYDELLATGRKLRAAQVGALQGRSTDVRAASDRHGEALTRAMAEAARLGKAGGVEPQADALRRMFEAISTRESLPAPHGRFVKPLEPEGFEALSGLSIAAAPQTKQRVVDSSTGKAERTRQSGTGRSAADLKAAEQEARRLEHERAEATRKRQAAIEKAETKVAEATKAEQRLRFEWERAKKDVDAAQRALTELRSSQD
jgi:hypothetical protein